MENLLKKNSTDLQSDKFRENYANLTNNSADRLIVDSKYDDDYSFLLMNDQRPSFNNYRHGKSNTYKNSNYDLTSSRMPVNFDRSGSTGFMGSDLNNSANLICRSVSFLGRPIVCALIVIYRICPVIYVFYSKYFCNESLY